MKFQVVPEEEGASGVVDLPQEGTYEMRSVTNAGSTATLHVIATAGGLAVMAADLVIEAEGRCLKLAF